MSFFRTLQAAVDPRIEAYTASSDTAQDTPVDRETPAPAPDQQHLFAAMAYFAEHPGAPDHTELALANLLGH